MKYLVWLSAFVLAACAAIISVSGLGKLFAGAGILVMLAMGGLEMTKLVAAGALHVYWDKLSVMIRIYMTAAVTVLVMITSLGIYGFLSGGYQDTANKLNIEDTQIELLENKQSVFDTRIVNNEKLIETKNDQVDKKNEQIISKQKDVNTMRVAQNNWSADKVDKQIVKINEDIEQLNADIDEIMVVNIVLADSSGVYGETIARVSANSEITGDIGPLKHISEATGLKRDTVINILMLLLIFVFDPMAVSLLILGFSIREIEKGEPKIEKPRKVKKERKPWITIDKIKSWIPKVKEKPVKVIEPEVIEPEVIEPIEEANPVFSDGRIVTKGKIDEDDIPMLRGDNKGKLWFKKGKNN
tara:strand:+ start:32488 stop:33558 length:1071 start_codon:yes stop_codon:yes gene_type:complete